MLCTLWSLCAGYPRYTGPVHHQFRQVLHSMNNEIGVSVSTSHAIFYQVITYMQSTKYGEPMNKVTRNYVKNRSTFCVTLISVRIFGKVFFSLTFLPSNMTEPHLLKPIAFMKERLGRRSLPLVSKANWTVNSQWNSSLVQARFPLQQSYRTELRQLYDQTVELVPLDFTRKTTLTNSQRVFLAEKKLRRDVFQERAQALNFCPLYATSQQEVGEEVDIWIGG